MPALPVCSLFYVITARSTSPDCSPSCRNNGQGRSRRTGTIIRADQPGHAA
ncbi:hypothetical protein KCP71_21905 [Salmonella enterica subsp. enterica]|nr:hypothetical protein KCP71_21905 [Salmonella enterica subsp. enterica]